MFRRATGAVCAIPGSGRNCGSGPAAYTRRMRGSWEQIREIGVAVLFFGGVAAVFVALFLLPGAVFRSVLMVGAVAAAIKAVVRPSADHGNLWVNGGLVALCILVLVFQVIDTGSRGNPVSMITYAAFMVWWGAPLIRRAHAARARKFGV